MLFRLVFKQDCVKQLFNRIWLIVGFLVPFCYLEMYLGPDRHTWSTTDYTFRVLTLLFSDRDDKLHTMLPL